MSLPQRTYTLTLLILLAVAWGVTLLIPRLRPLPQQRPPTPTQNHSAVHLLSAEAPLAEIIATVQVQTGLLLTREDALAYQALVRRGLSPEQALPIVLLYRQALLETL